MGKTLNGWCPETELNRRHADFQSGAITDISNAYAVEARQTGDGKTIAYPNFVKPERGHSKENPGALRGATGDKVEGIKKAFVTDYYQARADHATALCHAIAECHPHDACTIMAAALESLTEPHPYYPLWGDTAEAGFWADMATSRELWVYALACYVRLPAKDQAALLAYGDRA